VKSFRRRRPLGYRRFKEFVIEKALSIRGEARETDFTEEDLPPRRPTGLDQLRRRTSFLWFPFVHFYNKVRYTWVAKALGGVLCVILVMSGTWLAVMHQRVNQQNRWLAGRKNLIIAVLGKDDVEGHGRSDTLILFNVRYHEKKMNVLSIPRDSRVPIDKPGAGGEVRQVFSKANHALRWGGVGLTKVTIERYLGIDIDYHFLISYGLFVEIIDFIGGIPIEVGKRMFYVDRAGGLTIDLQKGFQILDGNRSLQYVRFRHDGQGDIGRIQRQQKFIRAAVEHIKKPRNFLRLVRHAPELLKHISTDIPLELSLLLLYHFKDIDLTHLRTKTLPGEEMTLPVRVGSTTKLSYYVSTKKQVDTTVNDYFLEVAEGEVRAKPWPGAFVGVPESKPEVASSSVASAVASSPANPSTTTGTP